MNQDRLNEIIAELARVHNVVLPKDDPALMLVTINAILAGDLAAELRALLQEFRETLVTQSSDWQKVASKKAEQVLNATVLAAKNAVAAGVQSALSESLPVFQSALQESAGRLQSQLAATRSLVLILAWIVAALILALAGGATLLAFHH